MPGTVRALPSRGANGGFRPLRKRLADEHPDLDVDVVLGDGPLSGSTAATS